MKRTLTPDETMLLWDAMRTAMHQWRSDAEKYPSTREDNLRRADQAEAFSETFINCPTITIDEGGCP